MVPLSGARACVSAPCCTSHITVVSVATETSVPSSTEPDAGSTQASYCRASTNTLSAGGSAAISTAVLTQSGSNGPNAVSSSQRHNGMHHELDQHQDRHLPRHARERPQRHRDAEREQRAGRRRVLEKLQQPVERDRRLEMQRRRSDAERGRDHERMQHDLARHVERPCAPAPCVGGRASAIISGSSEKNSSVSKQKISATGAAACAPTVASARPGPM